MLSFAAIFNLLQDATVVGISGEVPGSVRIEVDCDYLRDRLEGPGNRFFLTLSDCTRFIYRAGDSNPTDLDEIGARRLWISGADQYVGHCVVHCSEHIAGGGTGALEIAAQGITIAIDNGREISHDELEDIAEEYWSGIRAHQKPD